MKYERIKRVLITICVISGAFLLVMNTCILCTIVPALGYHLHLDDVAVAWLPIAHVFRIFSFIFVVALAFLFGIALVQCLNTVEHNRTKLLESEGETERGGGPD